MFQKGFIPSAPCRLDLQHAHLRTVVLVLSAIQYRFIKLVFVDPPVGTRVHYYFESCGLFPGLPSYKSLKCYANLSFSETVTDTASAILFLTIMVMLGVRHPQDN